LYGCETLPLTLKEEYRLKVFEDRVQRRIHEYKRKEVMGGFSKIALMRSFIICTLHRILLG
jgi:hypothetical protein